MEYQIELLQQILTELKDLNKLLQNVTSSGHSLNVTETQID